MKRTQAYLGQNWFWVIVNLAAFLPLALLIWDYAFGRLSVNPIDDLTDRTGKAAIILLLASLACTPAVTIFNARRALTVRKSLGLWAFGYASLHLLVYIGLDYGLDWTLILQDALLEKRFIIVGLIALAILLPLAITSTRGWMRRLGRNWKRLHQMVYVAGGLAVLHFFLLVKADRTEPLIYGGILMMLLAVRIPGVRRRVVQLRQRWFAGRTTRGQRQVNEETRSRQRSIV